MLKLHSYVESVLYHDLVPVGPIPTVEDPDGLYPYESFCETATRPALRKLRFISMENERLRVVICPDLGGKV